MAPSYRPDGTGVRTFVRSNVKDDRPLAGPDPAGSAVLLLAQPSSGYAGILYADAVAISMTLTANLAGSGTGSSNPSPSSGESFELQSVNSGAHRAMHSTRGRGSPPPISAFSPPRSLSRSTS